MLYWNATRHQRIDCWVLKNGKEKLGHVWSHEDNWYFNASEHAPKNHQLIPRIGTPSKTRLHAERRLLAHIGLKVKAENIHGSVTRTRTISIHELREIAGDIPCRPFRGSLD